MDADLDSVFRALADASRRRLLDVLRADNGQTLGRLCEHLDMTRQAVSKHMAALEKSNVDYLVVTSRPPPYAKKGQEYVYTLSVKSKKGGVTYKLDSGPKGMAIDGAGKLTWTPTPKTT